MSEPKRFCALCKLLLEPDERMIWAECATTRPEKMNNVKMSGYHVYVTGTNRTSCDNCTYHAWCKSSVWRRVTLPCQPEDARHAVYQAQHAETAPVEQMEMELICC